MPNDEPINRYEFDWVGGTSNSYFFITDNDIGYEIKFVPSAYLFDGFIDEPVDARQQLFYNLSTLEAFLRKPCLSGLLG
jgi:hypothetical protein